MIGRAITGDLVRELSRAIAGDLVRELDRAIAGDLVRELAVAAHGRMVVLELSAGVERWSRSSTSSMPIAAAVAPAAVVVARSHTAESRPSPDHNVRQAARVRTADLGEAYPSRSYVRETRRRPC